MQKDTLMHARTGGGGGPHAFSKGAGVVGRVFRVLTTVFFGGSSCGGEGASLAPPPGGDNKPSIKEHERSFSRGASEVASAIKDVTSLQEVVAPL